MMRWHHTAVMIGGGGSYSISYSIQESRQTTTKQLERVVDVMALKNNSISDEKERNRCNHRRRNRTSSITPPPPPTTTTTRFRVLLLLLVVVVMLSSYAVAAASTAAARGGRSLSSTSSTSLSIAATTAFVRHHRHLDRHRRVALLVHPRRRRRRHTCYPTTAAATTAMATTCVTRRWWRLYSSSSTSDDTDDDENANNKTYRIVFLGTPDVAATCLRRLHDSSASSSQKSATTTTTAHWEIAAVVTQPSKRRKRNKPPEPSPVAKVATELGVPVLLCPASAKDENFLTYLETQVRPDLCITAAYGQYLPKRFLQLPRLGTVNVHPSLLPKWRGASPVQRSLEAGDNPVGVSVLYTVSKMDAGPIIAQREREIGEDDTAIEVLPMLFELGTDLLLEALPKLFDGTITMETATPQDDSEATQAAMIDASEAQLRPWEEPARTLHNRLRGFAYWPQTFLNVRVGGDGEEEEEAEPIKLKVLKTRVVEGATGEPTDVIRLGPSKKDGLYVTCCDGSVLELVQVQPATRKAFPARDFQNGYPGKTIRWVKSETE